MREKMKTLAQSIIDVACKNDISQQSKENAILNLIENHIEEPLLDAASVWLCESFLEMENDYEKYLKGYHNDIPSAVKDLRNEMRKIMED